MMPIYDLFSKRQKRLRGEMPDVYTYGFLPRELQNQIVHIWSDLFDIQKRYIDEDEISELFKEIESIFSREHGLLIHPIANSDYHESYLDRVANSLRKATNVEKQLDIVELSFKGITHFTDEKYSFSQVALGAIDELNSRFKEHGLGYEFINGEIVRIDSELIHAEAVKPALRLLQDENYKGAEDEFRSAYKHYRDGNNKAAINDCLNSFESTMKSICDKRGWAYKRGKDSASKLIATCLDNGLVPEFLQNELSALKSLLESGIPTLRNNLSGHGQGQNPTSVPDHFVPYVLHMTASTIVFLTTAEKNLSPQSEE